MTKVRIYTKTGDKGKTSLFGGKRVSKDNLRIEAYGTLDEFNASLGAAESFIKDKKIRRVIRNIQNELFNIGAELANPQNITHNTRVIFHLDKSKAEELETIIDQYDKKLPILNTFILPSGTSGAAFIQLSRSIVRRAERRLISLSKKEKVNPNILMYTNRLSDLLFVISRYINHKTKISEKTWKK